ncbi:MAG: class II glutamine amidotransferase, partial [Deltaproteobacteria bacterium]
MCELLGMSSQAPGTVTCGLHELAQHSAAGPNRDGWGVAFHRGADVQLYRGAEPAGESAQARRLAEEGVPSRLVVAHIRHATQGGVALRNTQPFSRDLGGRTHLFAHNGDLAGIETLHQAKGGHFRPDGETDSERAFAVLMHRLEPLWRRALDPPSLEDRFERLLELAAWLRPLGPANFIYTDGDVVVLHG